jgi:preprotein translocase subunit SecY
MFDKAIHKLKLTFTDPAIRNRVLFLVAALVVFRFLAAIPIPGVDRAALQAFFTNNQFFGLLNVFSGGSFSRLSIVMLGVGPYITASIIMQLATFIFPQVKYMQTEEGEAGRTKFIMWSRMLTVPIAILQGVAFLSLLESQSIIGGLTPLAFASNVFLVTGGSLLLMWIGELITEFGIGNGVSLIIFAGIIARIPSGISQTLYTATTANIPAYLAFAAVALIVIYAVVVVSDAERSIPIAYARATRGAAMQEGAATYLPIRLLQTGVIPIIFALSLLLLPQMILAGLAAVGLKWLWITTATTWYTAFSANLWEYGAVYFVLVIIFTYFYTAVIIEPKRMADNLQKSGAFVPGVRPGNETEKYINAVINRITLPGAVFLGFVAVIPFIVQGITGISTILVGGTALLIAVQVVLDLVRKVDAQASLREY